MSCRFTIAFIAATVAILGSAQGAEVRQKVEVDGNKAEVWGKIGGWCAIGEWHPAIAKCEETTDAGTKRRTLTTKDGGVIKETMTESAETSYSYRIDESPLPVANYSASFAVVPDDDDQDEVNIVWSAKFDAKGASEEEAKKGYRGDLQGWACGDQEEA